MSKCPLLIATPNHFVVDCYGEECAWFHSVCKQPQKAKTNADRIRSMTDEELADWLGVYCNGQTAQEVGKPCVGGMGSCEACWLEWLKQEAAEEGE